MDDRTAPPVAAENLSTLPFLEAVLEQSPVAMWIADPDGVIVQTNRSLCRILGLSAAQIEGVYNILRDENLEAQGVMPQVRSVFEGLGPVQFTIYWRPELAGGDFTDSSSLHIDVSMFSLADEGGRLQCVVCQWADITAQIEANQRLEASNQQLRATEQQLRASNQQLDAGNQQLRAAHQQLQQMVTALEQGERLSKAGFFERNWETGEGFWSPGFWRLLGLEPQEEPLSHEDFMELVFEEDAARVDEYVKPTQDSRDPRTVEFRILRGDGEVIEIVGVIETSYHEDGRALRTQGTFQDVTPLRRSERALRSFQWLLEKDLPGGNPGAPPYKPPYDDVVALNTSRVILDAVGQQTLEAMARDLMDLLDTSVAVYERNGDYACGIFDSRWCRLFDSASFSLCQKTNSRDALTCGKWLCHENCWNDSVKTALAASAPTDIECVGGVRLYAVPIRAGNRSVGVINMGYGTPPRGEREQRALAERFNLPLDKIRRASLDYKPRPQFIIDVAKRRCLSIARAIGDAVEKSEIKARLAQADRLSSMGTLAAGVAHEINNPLTYTLYNLETVVAGLPAVLQGYRRAEACLGCQGESKEGVDAALGAAELDDLLDCAREALEGTQRIRTIAKTLGTFARVEDAESGPVNLRLAVEHARNMARNEIKYRARLVEELVQTPPVLGSDSKLSQVFLNLLINAAHAIEEGDQENNTIHLRSYTDEGYVVAEVSDTGRGIPEEDLSRLYEPFFTTKPAGQGSGLGLSISRKIIMEMGGDISCESRVGEGTTFHVRLPVLSGDRDKRGAGKAAEPPKEPGVRARILLVDDEPGIRTSLGRLLGRDHEVLTAASGPEAQEIISQDQDFDLILLDLMMPQVSGMDVHGWLVDNHPGLADRVIFVTGGVFTPHARDYLSKVPNKRLEKPVAIATLRQLVLEFISK